MILKVAVEIVQLAFIGNCFLSMGIGTEEPSVCLGPKKNSRKSIFLGSFELCLRLGIGIKSKFEVVGG